MEKSVVCWREKDVTYMAWYSGNDGLAQRQWREAFLRGDSPSQLYRQWPDQILAEMAGRVSIPF